MRTSHAPTLEAVTTAFELSPVPQALIGTDATFITVNRAGRELLGYSEVELRGASFTLVTDDRSLDTAMNSFFELAIGDADTICIDVWLLHKDGSVIEVELTAAAVRTERGAPLYFTVAAVDVSEPRRRERAAHHRAAHDALTELPNRTWFMERLEQALGHADRRNSLVGVYFVDLDGFKQINDDLGHRVGDEVLFTLAGRLAQATRPGDTLARYGGDEFTLICEDLRGTAAAGEIAERLIACVGKPLLSSGGQVTLSASVGVALADPGELTAANLIHRADLAMYDAKRAGKGRYVICRGTPLV
jgi:diguanylate cyclase (GGDEF)-like protein/PAS domain S-box-containing protein